MSSVGCGAVEALRQVDDRVGFRGVVANVSPIRRRGLVLRSESNS